MTEKRMFIIPEDLMEKIEKYRGEMSRSEFVDYCVNCVVKGKAPKAPTPPREDPPPASKSDIEFEQLKHRVLRTLEGTPMPTLNSSVVEGAQAQAPSQPQPQPMPVASGGLIPSGIAAGELALNPHFEQVQVKVEEEQESKKSSMPFSWLWVPALLFFGFGDTLTSHLVFANGGQEANPFMSMAMNFAGGGMMGFVAMKAIIMVSLVLLSWFWMKKHRWVVPTALSIVGGYLVGHNITTLMGIM